MKKGSGEMSANIERGKSVGKINIMVRDRRGATLGRTQYYREKRRRWRRGRRGAIL